MIKIERYDPPGFMKGVLNRRNPNRVLMATQFGYYPKNEWTKWADDKLLKSKNVLRFIKGKDYDFWLKWFDEWISSEDKNEQVQPLLRHVPEVTEVIGMRPLWAMSFEEKGIRSCPTGVSWCPRLFRISKPVQCKEALERIGFSESLETAPFRIERECFASIYGSPTDLEPTFVERLYNDDTMKVFSVLTRGNHGRWLLRCGNQEANSDRWNIDYKVNIPELEGENLWVGDNFPRVTRRLLRVRRPFVEEFNDPSAFERYGYSRTYTS